MIKSVIEKIKSVEQVSFEQITVDGETYKYRLFQQPINLKLSEVKGLPVKYDVSPMYLLASLESLIGNTILSPSNRFDAFLQLWENRDTASKNLQNVYGNEKEMWKKITDEFANTICLAEFRKNDLFAIIVFQDELFPRPKFDFDGMPLAPEHPFLVSIGGYIKNNRYYLENIQISEESKPFSYKVLSISENELRDKFFRNNTYFKKPEPPPKDTWRIWKTFLKDYEVEAEFVYFDGKFVTLMKRDGTKEKIEYKKLSLVDEFYVDEAVAEQKKRYEQELKDLPKKIKESLREWITKIHDYKVKGEFVDYDGKFVTIKKEDGQIEKIEYSRLCLDDKNYVQEKMLQKKRNNRKILK